MFTGNVSLGLFAVNPRRDVYRNLKILAFAPVLNEKLKIAEVIKRTPMDVADEVLIVDDGSDDGSPDVCRALGATVVELGRTMGVGAAIRRAFTYAIENGFDVIVVMAGNNKDFPEHITNLIDPIADGCADFVQGSRYLHEEQEFGPMPLYRKFATRVHPWMFSRISGQRITDSTNGFRAIHTKLLTSPLIDVSSSRLDNYELEPFIFMSAIRQGFKVVEVPARKVYPPKNLGQTKMKPITGWWSILRPLVWLFAQSPISILRSPKPAPRTKGLPNP